MPNAAGNVETMGKFPHSTGKVQRVAGKVQQTVLSWAHRDSQMKAVCFGNLLSILTVGIIYVSCMLLYPYLESVCIALLLVSVFGRFHCMMYIYMYIWRYIWRHCFRWYAPMHNRNAHRYVKLKRQGHNLCALVCPLDSIWACGGASWQLKNFVFQLKHHVAVLTSGALVVTELHRVTKVG